MLKTLFKKQMMELFSFFWLNKKKNQRRTGVRLAAGAAMYVALFGVIAGIFVGMSLLLCEPLTAAGMDWLYFTLTGLVGVVLGVFGSVFNTYASLYLSKDNDLLLSMPIPTWKILVARLSGVYAMGLLYELLVMLPALAVYCVTARPGPAAALCALWTTLVLSVFVLTLSAILGWGVALISARAKHRSLLVVVLSLAFLGGYYYLYAKAYQMLIGISNDPSAAGEAMMRIQPLYLLGRGAAGDLPSLLLLTGMVLALFAATMLVLARSYARIATDQRGEAKASYRERRASMRSVDGALLSKELRRFLGSPNYMLNCGLGCVFMLIALAALLIKAGAVRETAAMLIGSDESLLPLLAAAAICTLASMCDISAPSVSLEGKNLWLVQSLPVPAAKVLTAKLRLHLALTLIPAMLLTAGAAIVLKPTPASAALLFTSVIAFILFMAAFGLFLNLKLPNLQWTNEIVPIKQSASVTVALFGGWVLVAGLAGLWFLARRALSPALYLLCVTLLLLAAFALLLTWIRRRGARILETL
ncbi:MAG: hypothetical protein ACI4MF_01445 [Candidatus Faecivicinus sp.]